MGAGTTVKGGTDYPTHPADTFAAVCCDVIDMGPKATKFGVKEFIRLVFYTGEWGDVGSKQIPLVLRRDFTKTLGKDSNLRKTLESWRGTPFTEEQLSQGFDVDVLFGAPALVSIVHNQNGDKTYANVDTVLRLPKAMKGSVPDLADLDGHYTRVADLPRDERDEYMARFRGEAKPAAAGLSGAEPRGRSVADGHYEDKPATKRGKTVEQVIEDEDDDLPF